MGKELTKCKGQGVGGTKPFQVCPKPEMKRVWGGVGRRRHAPLREAPTRALPYAELSPNPRPGSDPVTAREPVWRKVDREPASRAGRGRWNLAARGENVSLAAAVTCPVVSIPRGWLWSEVCLWLLPTLFPQSLSLRGSYSAKRSPPKLHHLAKKEKGKKKKRKSRVCARGSGRARPRLRPVTAARGSQPGRSAALGSRGLGRVATDICTVLQRTARTPSPPALGPAAAPPPASDPPISPRAVSLRSLQDQGEWKGECHQRASGLQGNHINLARHASAHTPCVTALPSVT